MQIEELLIAYEEHGEKFHEKITTTEDDIEKITQDYQMQNPNRRVTYAFRIQDDIIQKEMHRKRQFDAFCDLFGLTQADYGTGYINTKTGHPYKLIGVLPRNKKYKLLLSNLATGEHAKTTVESFQRLRRLNPLV